MVDSLNEADLTIEHIKLRNGLGFLRVIHQPTGLSVESHVRAESPVKVLKRLKEDLKAKLGESLAEKAKVHM